MPKEGVLVILRNTKLFAIFSLLAIPQIAFANAGVPMIFLVMPAFALSLIPIIIIEAIYLCKKLDLPAKVAGKTVTVSNIVSTVVGVPLTWFILVLIQMVTGGGGAYGLNTVFTKVLAVTWQAPWLIPYESNLNWMIPVAGLVLLIPFFFASWWSEYFVTKKMHKDINAALLKMCVRNANLTTYGLLSLWPIIMLIMPNE